MLAIHISVSFFFSFPPDLPTAIIAFTPAQKVVFNDKILPWYVSIIGARQTVGFMGVAFEQPILTKKITTYTRFNRSIEESPSFSISASFVQYGTPQLPTRSALSIYLLHW